MLPFAFRTADSPAASVKGGSPDAAFLAGGTNLADLMKLNVLTPATVEYVRPALSADAEDDESAFRPGAGMSMAALADHPVIRERFPAVRHSLILAASPQIRQMATIGGNLLQRTRCPYYRHTEFACNKREPGSGCDALEPGADRHLAAVLGVSEKCVANYPGDLAVALAAVGALVKTERGDGGRTIPVAELHALPGDSPEVETVLRPGELIVSFELPKSPVAANMWYCKIRERSSYAFALASAAVGLELDGAGPGAAVKAARVALGGVGVKPWRSPEAEAALVGGPASDAAFAGAADAALADARPPAGTAWKAELAKRAVVFALRRLRDEGVPDDAALFALQHGREAS